MIDVRYNVNKMESRKCKICGKIRKISQFQKRKIVCERCSYKLKKARVKSKYWQQRSNFLNKKLKGNGGDKNGNQ